MSLAPRIAQILVAVTLAGLPGALRAQDAEEQSGTWFTTSLGYQRGCYTLTDRHCLGGPALRLGLGKTLGGAVQVGVASTSLLGWSEVEDQLEFGGSLTAVARVYPVPRAGLVLTGGLGIGSILLTPDRLGLAVEAGLGYDLRLARRVSLTPNLAVLRIRDPYRPTTYLQAGLAVTLD